MKLNPKALGLTLGILWGMTVLLCTLWITVQGGGGHLLLLKQFYWGYSVSFTGAIVGMLYGFVNGFLGGWIVAWVYNRFAG